MRREKNLLAEWKFSGRPDYVFKTKKEADNKVYYLCREKKLDSQYEFCVVQRMFNPCYSCGGPAGPSIIGSHTFTKDIVGCPNCIVEFDRWVRLRKEKS